ncbi:MAG: hypothetical protein HUU15_20265 [Candidatus Brocadiae bacterium]|nr:hypothetical protein [Candidatus Brocadiia bacterium]
MAARKSTKRCPACGKEFKARNRVHQYCSRETCRAARRAGYMKKYMAGWKRKHPNYWKTDRQREYMKDWRESHPEYFRVWRERQRRRARAKE